MARVPLAGTELDPRAAGVSRDRGRRHRRRRARGRRRGVGAEPSAASPTSLSLERDTVGSGMTGKSSGIVRCHYGVSSLAAMATVGLEVFEQRRGRSSAPTSASGRPATSSASASRTSTRCARASPRSAPSACETEEIDAAEVAELWPYADLTPFAAFGVGGARRLRRRLPDRAGLRGVGARRPASRIRQGARSPSCSSTATGSPACGCADGSEIAADTVVVATGVVDAAAAGRRYGVDVPIRVHREQIVHDRAGRRRRRRCRCSPTWCRCSTSGRSSAASCCSATATSPTLEMRRPRRLPQPRRPRLRRPRPSTRSAPASPASTDAAITSSYAGCYDVTPGLEPGDLARPDVDGLVVAAGFSGHGFKISPAVGRLVADLVIDGRSRDPRIPETDFRLSRFAEGDPLKTPYPYVGAGEMR